MGEIFKMPTFCFSPKRSSANSWMSHFPTPSRLGYPTPTSRSLTDSVMSQTIELAESVIMKWDPDTSTYAKVTSLFYENRKEAKDFIKCVNNLQKAMHSLVSENSSSELLVRAQNLMQIAMKRLQKEFYQILSMNRAYLDPESVSTRSSRASTRSSVSDFGEDYVSDSDEIRVAGELITEVEDASEVAMTDLRLIAECMILSGYGKECVKIYNIIRKSIVDEGIYKLGVEKQKSSHIHKMDWQVLDLKIKNWLNAVRVSVKTLFNGERILCDHVFASSDSIRESCFTEITKEGASILFGFPENVVKNSKRSPEKIFRTLDMYTAIAGHWPDIESIFSFQSTSGVVSQALNSLVKLGESTRSALNEFETFIQKESSKALVAGAGVHNLTIEVMNSLSLLADYNVLSDILFDSPPLARPSLPESYFDTSDFDDSGGSAVSLRFAWLILVLLCKLDGKAKHYKDLSSAYIFLANNLQHVISRVRTSNLKYLLGENWISNHESKVMQFAANYERLGWSQVIDAIPANPTAISSPEEVKEAFKRFNAVFDEAHRKQSACVVPDSKLRDEIKHSIAKKLIPAYRELYNVHGVQIRRGKKFGHVVRYTPEDLGHQLSDLFFGTGGASTSSSSSHSRPSRSR